MALVVFFMLDGVRPDALSLAACPNLQALIKRGSFTLSATSVMPCLTLPCHTSIFYSVPPTRHGITSNVWTPMARPLRGLIEVARQADRKTAFFYNWEPLRDLTPPGALHFACYRDNSFTADGDQVIADEAARFIAADRPDFAFVYFGTIDIAGHEYGWLSNEYLRQLERADAALGTVLSVLSDQYSIVLHSDHGGHDRNHGQDVSEDMTIPWLAAGPTICRDYAIGSPVTLLDTAPTIARLLDLQPDAQWEGHCVEEIFDRTNHGTYSDVGTADRQAIIHPRPLDDEPYRQTSHVPRSWLPRL
jgi:hypothetical protein